MNYKQLLTITIVAAIFAVSCKNDTSEKVADTPPAKEVKKAEVPKRELTPEQKDKVNSLWAKLSMRPDTKNFIRLMTSAEIADTLLVPSSKFTIFAPTNESFSIFTEKINITNNPAQKEALATLLKNHMVAGNVTSSSLVQTIKEKGKMELTTITGQKLTATMDGDAIILTNKAGTKATVKKSDITASNGVLHVIDVVLQ